MFSTRSNLYKHSRKCKQAHECNTCHEKFESHDVLCHHVYKIHSLFLCRMCDKVVDSAENYADHVNFCHPNYSLDDVVSATTALSENEGVDSSCEGGRGRTGLRNQPFVRSGSCMGALGMGGNRGKVRIRIDVQSMLDLKLILLSSSQYVATDQTLAWNVERFFPHLAISWSTFVSFMRMLAFHAISARGFLPAKMDSSTTWIKCITR